VPADRTEESVSRTVEFGIDDHCTAQMARELAPPEHERLLRRSESYRRLYNPATGLLEPKDSRGAWFPSKAEGFTEGNPWTYAFGATHDIPGMIALMGGRERFVQKLDENFDRGHHRHDNEPGHHYPYLYDYAGQPWKTQARVRDILARQYRDRPDGLAGNDDCGQMSAWYVFGAIGLYPVTPASGIYALGSPLFDEVVLHLTPPLGSGTFVVRARNQSPANVYVQSARLDGKPLAQPFLRHADLVRGDTVLELEMGPRPNPGLWR
jgi:predicted alpha-1,2-mannosidase